jgi:DUF971 family protein
MIKAGQQPCQWLLAVSGIVKAGRVGQILVMRPLDIQAIGTELAVKWADGTESFITLELLRRACPCAGCKGEMDIMGNLYKGPDVKLRPESFVLRQLVPVGTYAVQPTWGDGHNSGIYSFEYLRGLVKAGSRLE